jgi:hypothetical protein
MPARDHCRHNQNLDLERGRPVTSDQREFLETRRAMANAKLVEYRRQCWRLAYLMSRGLVGKAAAVDLLWEVAIGHALVRALGEDRIQAIISEAFAAVHREAA